MPGIGADGLPIGNRQVGVFINDDAKLDTIGGSTAAALNLISGNGSDGVEILGVGVASNLDPSNTAVGDLVIGNDIGTDASKLMQDGMRGPGSRSTTPVPMWSGCRRRKSDRREPGRGSRDPWRSRERRRPGGVRDQQSDHGEFDRDDHLVQTLVGNRGDGVTIVEAAANQVGGTAPGEANAIVGNGGNGVSITSNSGVDVIASNLIGDNTGNGVAIDANSDSCTVVGNMIGVAASGEVAMGNGLDGVVVSDAGSSTGVVSNVISANTGAGVEVSGNSPLTVIQGNAIVWMRAA